jgi:glycosyltransferase involved in cell wall biosynthesis
VLTASPLVVARQLGIPYIVTLHDAWWLSPELFLVSPGGRQIDPAKPFDHIDGVPTPEEKTVALERRSILAGILRGAQQRLAVSEPFRNVYRKAGIENVDVRENVSTPMPPSKLRQRHTHDSPLRICHAGGMAMHKGYHVLRQAAMMLPEGLNVSFTVVDHHLQDGDAAYTSTWNHYPVEFVPPIAMNRMQDFYAVHDVLIAPSIWPESFGLVTREAISAGLYVIASNIGALSDPIANESIGLSITPGDCKELCMAITRISKKGSGTEGSQA